MSLMDAVEIGDDVPPEDMIVTSSGNLGLKGESEEFEIRELFWELDSVENFLNLNNNCFSFAWNWPE